MIKTIIIAIFITLGTAMCCSCEQQSPLLTDPSPKDVTPPKAGMPPKVFMSADGKTCEVRLPAQNCNGKEKVLWKGVISYDEPTSHGTLYERLVIKAYGSVEKPTVNKTVYCVKNDTQSDINNIGDSSL